MSKDGLRDKRLGLFNCDCIEALDFVQEGAVDLLYLDPPFGTGNLQSLGKYSYEDRLTGEEYLRFLDQRLKVLVRTIDDQGFLVIHLDQDHVSEVKDLLDRKYDIPFKGDIIWSYRRWSSQKQSLQNNHDSILIYSFNANYSLKRAIWGIPIVAPSSNERCGYPTQKPIRLLKRLIQYFEGYTDVSTVMDPFMGSGTTLVAAKSLQKTILGFDVSKDAYLLTKSRLQKPTVSVSGQLELGLK